MAGPTLRPADGIAAQNDPSVNGITDGADADRPDADRPDADHADAQRADADRRDAVLPDVALKTVSIYYGHVVTGARATLRNCTVSGNAIGILADAGTVTLTGCTVFGNQVGLQSLNGGVLQSYGNNNLMDPGAGATSLALK